MSTFSFGMARLCSSCIVFNGGMAADTAGSIATVFEWTWVAGARDLLVVVATEVVIGMWRGSSWGNWTCINKVVGATTDVTGSFS